LNVSEFDYELPEERIAQEPLAQRDASRLMVLARATGAFEDRRFHELPDLLAPGDLVVLNDTKVIPARLFGRKESGGRIEILLLDPEESAGGSAWRCMVRGSKSLFPGASMRLDGGLLAELVAKDGETCVVRFRCAAGELAEALERVGRVPLPPYIRRAADDRSRDAADRERYQTVFARAPGAVAAPTAGLHFTDALLEHLARRGVEVARLTLHTSGATFLPVRTERVEDHRMHAERFEIPEATAAAVAAARARQGRVVAVGTTVVRTLEANATAERMVRAGAGRSDLFLYPGAEFRVVDALVTNFHLPKSTLLMLVAAFAGKERVLAAYRAAVLRGYRFFSYGDAMLIA